MPLRSFQHPIVYGAFFTFGLFVDSAGRALLDERVLASYKPTSESMLPTLAPHDRYLVTKLTPRDSEPLPGDVIVFRPPFSPDEAWGKRVVAVAGQRVDYAGDVLSIDDEPSAYVPCGEVDAERLRHLDGGAECRMEILPSGASHAVAYDPAAPEGARVEGLVVPEGHVFVLGDNRNQSVDSRVFGPVPLEALVGRAHTLWRRADGDAPFADIGRIR